jgi:hypothetical protein
MTDKSGVSETRTGRPLRSLARAANLLRSDPPGPFHSPTLGTHDRPTEAGWPVAEVCDRGELANCVSLPISPGRKDDQIPFDSSSALGGETS